MSTTEQARTFTVRFPAQLHRTAAETALAQHRSLSELIRQATEAYLREEQDRQLFDSYTRLGEDLAECDVEFAWEAQREAIESVDVQD